MEYFFLVNHLIDFFSYSLDEEMAKKFIEKEYEKPMIVLYAFALNGHLDSQRILNSYFKKGNYRLIKKCDEIFAKRNNTEMMEKLIEISNGMPLPKKIKVSLHINLVKSYLKLDMGEKALNASKKFEIIVDQRQFKDIFHNHSAEIYEKYLNIIKR